MNDIRFLITDDCGFLHRCESQQHIEQWVAHYRDQGIDALAWDLLGGDMGYYRSDVVETNPDYPRCTRLIEQDVDPPGVIADLCHRHGIGYWPAVRLNAQRLQTQFKRDNPDAVLTATTVPRPGMLDYESPKVQRLMLDAMRELVDRWDADGLLLNFVRYWVLFQEDRLIDNAPILTQFLGQVRAMLDEVGRKKGKYLPLAAQVLPRVSACQRFGMDVKAWAQQGHVQFLLPSRGAITDFNLPVEQFTSAADGTDCRVFPVLHPATNHPLGAVGNRMSPDMFRACAHNYYHRGAHGLATMNLGHFPKGLIRELRDAERVEQGGHHYHYSNHPYDFSDGRLNFLIETPLSRAGAELMPTTRKVLPFHMATDPGARASGILKLKFENMHPTDELHIELNGEPIPRPDTFGDQGPFTTDHELCRSEFDGAGHGETRHYLYTFDVATIPLIQGENELGLQVLSNDTPQQGLRNVLLTQMDVILP